MKTAIRCLLFVVLTQSLLCFQGVNTGRILFYMPSVTKSVTITFMPLAKELAERGHEVVIVTNHEEKDVGNGIDLILVHSPFVELTNNMSRVFLAGKAPNQYLFYTSMVESVIEANENALKSSRLRRQLEKGFDLILVQYFVGNEVGYYLAHKSNASLVLYGTHQRSMSAVDWAMGQPHNPAFLPYTFSGFEHPMTFLERVRNTLLTYAMHAIRDTYQVGRGESLIDQYFPGDEDRPSLLELERKASLMLHFGHPLIMDGMRPVAPNYQYIGMMNCKDSKPLPTNLESFVQNAKDGVILVSFGSVLQATQMTEEKRRLLLNVFGALKQKILWKWETEDMDGKPGNLKLSKWLPQQDLLGHPNVKLFITHAGQSSIQETICHQKPIVGIPVYGDQLGNSKEAVRRGFGEYISYEDLTEKGLLMTIQQVLDDPKYTKTAREYGSLMMDQITRPMDRSIWWLEFVMRHKGKNYFHPPVHDLQWYQYFLLDVIAFPLAILVIMIYATCAVLRTCCRTKRQPPPPPALKRKKVN